MHKNNKVMGTIAYESGVEKKEEPTAMGGGG
jgi:hypothetical protein